MKSFPPLQSSLRHKITYHVTGSLVISAFSILLENENNFTTPSITKLLRKTRRPFICGNFQWYCQIVIFIWSPSRQVSLYFLVLGRKNFPLLFWILLAALRIRLTWAKVTGEKQINNVHERNPYKYERFPKQEELCTYAILSKREGCRVLGTSKREKKFTGIWKRVNVRQRDVCWLHGNCGTERRILTDYANFLPVHHPYLILAIVIIAIAPFLEQVLYLKPFRQ